MIDYNEIPNLIRGLREENEKLKRIIKDMKELPIARDNVSLKEKLKETQEKLKIAVDALEFYADLDTGVKEKYKKARQALEKIGEL